MLLRIQEDDASGRRVARDIPIRAGEMFFLPPRVPHSPQRMPGSVGLVIERRRLPRGDDALMWFCVNCNHELYAESFHLVDIEQDFFRVFENFYRSDALRTCRQCGTLNPRRPATNWTRTPGGHHLTPCACCATSPTSSPATFRCGGAAQHRGGGRR